MPLYELGVIIDPEMPPEEETAFMDRLEGIVTAAGGEVAAKDPWGRRQLAYPIRKKNYGVYHFWRLNVGGDIIDKLNFELRTNDAVMRSLVLNMDNELRRKRKMDAKHEARLKATAARAAARAEAVTDED